MRLQLPATIAMGVQSYRTTLQVSYNANGDLTWRLMCTCPKGDTQGYASLEPALYDLEAHIRAHSNALRKIRQGRHVRGDA